MEEVKTKYTEEGYKKLVDELEYLKGPKMKEVKEALAAARELGDLSENSEYDEAKNDQAKIEARIAELEVIISNAEIIDPKNIKTDKVSFGCKVTLFDKTYNEENSYYIVGSAEADPMNGRLSDKSPLGAALLGKKKGEHITVPTPNGGSIDYEILKIEKSE